MCTTQRMKSLGEVAREKGSSPWIRDNTSDSCLGQTQFRHDPSHVHARKNAYLIRPADEDKVRVYMRSRGSICTHVGCLVLLLEELAFVAFDVLVGVFLVFFRGGSCVVSCQYAYNNRNIEGTHLGKRHIVHRRTSRRMLCRLLF